MPSRPSDRVVLSLLITSTFVVGLLAAATAQDLPSTVTDGTILSSEETTVVLVEAAGLTGRGPFQAVP
jgi:hypothetical protein